MVNDFHKTGGFICISNKRSLNCLWEFEIVRGSPFLFMKPTRPPIFTHFEPNNPPKLIIRQFKILKALHLKDIKPDDNLSDMRTVSLQLRHMVRSAAFEGPSSLELRHISEKQMEHP